MFLAVQTPILSIARAAELATPTGELNDFQLSYAAEAFGATTNLSVNFNNTPPNLPWQWQALTPSYEYSFTNAAYYDPSRPMSIKISYNKTNNYYKQIFSYDAASNTWRPLPTKDNPAGNYVTATTTATADHLVLLTNPDTLVVGRASWYKYKGGLFAASPDFAKGSKLRVYNLANNKFVDVTVNDWGPDRAKYPDRAIDLDQEAFKKIALASDGVINVRVEPLTATILQTTTKTPTVQNAEPTITAKSAVIMSEKDGTILWGKNATSTSPLASLTKLVAVRVFLDTKPDLKKVVTYKIQDENYNYEYCRPGESAKLSIKAGEKLTVENLIYAALVGSANNAVESLVRVSGLTRADFVKKMNSSVKKWGATSTTFIEPTGLSPDNVSSPADYAIITKAVFTNSLMKKVTTTKKYTFKMVGTKKYHTIKNTDQLVRDGTYPIIGSKTGYLVEAGHCLMTRVQTPKGNLIVVNFGSKSTADNTADNEQLIRYGERLLGVKP